MIPKNIFITVYDKNQIHEKIQKNIDRLKSKNPEYTLIIHDQNSFEELIKEIAPNDYKNYYSKLNPNFGAMLSDYQRQFLMYHFGGVYIDCKSNFKKRLCEFVGDKSILFRWEKWNEYCSGCLIWSKGHPLTKLIIEGLHQNISNYEESKIDIKKSGFNVINMCGPKAMLKTILKYNIEKDDSIIVKQLTDFFIYHATGRDYRTQYELPHYSKVREHLIITKKYEDLYFINSFKRNEFQALRLKENLESLGINEKNIKIIYGYDLELNPKIKKNELVFLNFFHFILPEMINSKKNCYYLEDHTIVCDNPEKYQKNNKMVWLGFIKKLSNFIVGAHLIYLDKDLIKELEEEKDSYKPQHIDRFFKTIGENKGYLQIDNSITQIVEHHSINLNTIRKNPKNKHFKILT